MKLDVPRKRIRTCEFSGDATFFHDSKPANERSCEHLGLGRCLKHNVPLGEFLGWAECASECRTPFQVKEWMIT